MTAVGPISREDWSQTEKNHQLLMTFTRATSNQENQLQPARQSKKKNTSPSCTQISNSFDQQHAGRQSSQPKMLQTASSSSTYHQRMTTFMFQLCKDDGRQKKPELPLNVQAASRTC